MSCIDLSGQKFGRLTVINRMGNKGKHLMWLCKCECGNETIVRGGHLSSGGIKSCGCLAGETKAITGKKVATKHNMSHSSTYRSWSSMLSRCNNPSTINYKDYGGRGIKVCQEWRNFENFLSDMGEKPERLTIDRINVNGNYCKDNCKWSSYKEQYNNKRNNHIISYKGESKTMTQWADCLKISVYTLSSRLCRGWSIERSFTTPIRRVG